MVCDRYLFRPGSATASRGRIFLVILPCLLGLMGFRLALVAGLFPFEWYSLRRPLFVGMVCANSVEFLSVSVSLLPFYLTYPILRRPVRINFCANTPCIGTYSIYLALVQLILLTYASFNPVSISCCFPTFYYLFILFLPFGPRFAGIFMPLT